MMSIGRSVSRKKKVKDEVGGSDEGLWVSYALEPVLYIVQYNTSTATKRALAVIPGNCHHPETCQTLYNLYP